MVSPATWERIALLKDETGSARPLVPGQPISIADGPAERLAGVPVWVSEGMPDDRALVVDPTALLIVRRSGIELEVFEHFGFSTGEVGLRAIVRLSLVVSQPASVAVITGIPTT
jgi:HK97 family phage major capsid protein